jgi:hypothetical protein
LHVSVVTEILGIVRRHSNEAIDEIGQLLVSEEDMLAILDGLDSVDWAKTGELQGQKYSWPGDVERFDPFEVWEGGGYRMGVGYRTLEDAPSYVGIFRMDEGTGKRPLVYFTEADDFAATHERLSPIRGKDGGRAFFAPGEHLPPEYDEMTIETFRDRIAGRWNVQAVVAKDGDMATMLNHATAQIRLRNL